MHRRHVHKASVCPGRIKAHTFGYSLKSHEEVQRQSRKSQNAGKIKWDEIYMMYNYNRVHW